MAHWLRWVAAALLAAGCEGEVRNYALPLRTDAGAEPLVQAAAAEAPGELTFDTSAPAPLGAACTAGGECGSGFCVDGVCCRSSCDTVCSRCDGPGTAGECTLADSDAACGLSCPASTDCRSYGSGGTGSNCDAVGLCRVIAECRGLDAPEGTSCENGSGACDGRGECIVADKKRLGAACAADEECAEGNCVVGGGGVAICCDGECGGLCQTCGATGRCNETPRDDGRCNPVDCPADNLCRDYVDDLDVNLCRSFGQCRTAADCTFSELRAGAQCACGPGGCQLTAGSACDQAEQCASGLCETTVSGARVCCAQDCGSSGSSCSSDGQRCVQCEASSHCQNDISQLCTDGVPSSQSCGNGCDPATGRCNRERPQGTPCAAGAECQSGSCALDVSGTQRCCVPGCEATGRVCGADGSCVCPAGSQEVAGTCRLELGQSCTQGSQCVSGLCAGLVQGGSVCCSQGCNGAFCAADGASCVECAGTGSVCQGTTSARCESGSFVRSDCANGCNPTTGLCNGLRPNGETCMSSAQCGSSVCALDTSGVQRCCAANCAATGRVCAGDGSCVCPNPGDVFANGVCGCPAGTRSCGGGRCVANNQCCETCTGGRTCQGGNCACAAGQQFINGQCRLSLGAACSPTGTPCATGQCVDGVCCESPCDGVCMQCQAGSGRCVMPADDAACPAVFCPTPSNRCLQTTDITTNRCQSVGQCKTAANCVSTAAPVRSSCGPGTTFDCGVDSSCSIPRLCSASGICSAPTIGCAGANLEIGANTCCVLPFRSPSVVESVSTFCEPAGSGEITVLCDGTNDCPSGNSCCLTDFGNFNTIACTATCSSLGGSRVVCRSPAGGTSACPQGTTCQAFDDLPGWSLCR